jgi:hypothetical protein
MTKFIKQYWIYFAAFILSGLCLNLWFNSTSMADAYAAIKLELKTKAAYAQKEKDRAEKYAEINARLAEQLENSRLEVDKVTAKSKHMQGELAKSHKEIATLKTCADREIALSFTLSQCENNLKTITDDFVIQIGNLTLSYDTIVKQKNTEIGELIALKTTVEEKYSALVGKYASKSRQFKLRAAIYVGMGVVVGLILKSR